MATSTLQQHLEMWVEKCSVALGFPQGSVERLEAIKEFCREFVPMDISQEDSDAYAQDLAADEVKLSLHSSQANLFSWNFCLQEFFNSTCRELSQCALNTGANRVVSRSSRLESTIMISCRRGKYHRESSR